VVRKNPVKREKEKRIPEEKPTSPAWRCGKEKKAMGIRPDGENP